MPTIDPNNPLGLLFIASFAVQQILEAISWPLESYVGAWWRRRGYADDSWKKTVFGVIGFIIGMYLAWQLDLHILEHYIPAGAPASGLRGGPLDTFLTALVLSAGTEGTNSVLKYLKYLKEDRKAGAAESVKTLTESERGASAVPVSADALKALDMLRAKAIAEGATSISGSGDAPAAAAARPSGSRSLSYINNK